MKVVIIGKGEMLSNLIQGVLDSGFDIVGVLRHERVFLSRIGLLFHDFLKSSSDVTLIKKHKLYEIKCKSANSEAFKKEILRLNADIILVGTWSEKLKKEIINLPAIAAINVHPSLLPKYRGPNPYIQTILHGETKSGVTFHLMSENLDGGAILAQEEINILPYDTAKELKEKTVVVARVMACELLKILDKNSVKPIPQNENEASYFSNISGDEKMLDFVNMTSTQIINTVRALHPYLPTYITYGNKFFVVNPYKVNLTDIKGNAGEIIEKSDKDRSLTLICKDGIGVKLSGLRLYRLPFFTSFYIKHFVKI